MAGRGDGVKRLREGFSTGTAAAGAALAALTLLAEGRVPSEVFVPLPPFDDGSNLARLPVEQRSCRPESPSCAVAAVCKDGGDDPDVTSGALIVARVNLTKGVCGDIRIDGGDGVGRVTLPGLPLPVGEAAINPVPREQMRIALRRYASEKNLSRQALSVVISVPGGAKLARRTLNPRLGIVGGISILGTQGTVRPFSHEAWKATVRQGLNVALQTGCATVCLSTGRRSEALLRRRYPELAPQAFIQAADFVSFSLKTAGVMPFAGIVWGCFFGKLLKLAQGMENTHARKGDIDFERLADLCLRSGARCADAVRAATTAAHALDDIRADGRGQEVLLEIAARAAARAAGFAGRPVRIHLFHPDGGLLCAA
ncbi:MAG: cobalt-precorrin-5B (C(1))-methyltransferase CbiD [Desulfovibrio sp.]|jgi:cobalt-precorrin-5B (C1)-methyltransferase|nr:cobalt-precorrin-5B (C(1))-methyltransferase CbiD [Desulfovibrio sp.]